jgi:hypothetical protein
VARVPIACPARGRCAGIVRVRVDGRIADRRRFSLRTRSAQRHATVRLDARPRALLRRHTRVDARVTVQIGRQRTRQSVTLTA